jgi:hypothetical protein
MKKVLSKTTIKNFYKLLFLSSKKVIRSYLVWNFFLNFQIFQLLTNVFYIFSINCVSFKKLQYFLKLYLF